MANLTLTFSLPASFSSYNKSIINGIHYVLGDNSLCYLKFISAVPTRSLVVTSSSFTATKSLDSGLLRMKINCSSQTGFLPAYYFTVVFFVIYSRVNST